MSKLKQRQDFAFITVSLDDKDTLPGLRKLIRKHRIKYPVLWFGPEDVSWGELGWNIRGVPDAYLIDPQGNILLHTYVDETFADRVTYIIDHPGQFSPFGMEWTAKELADGNYSLTLHVTNPLHSPLNIKLEVAKGVKEYVEERNGELVPIDPIPAGKEWNCSSYYTLDGYSDYSQLVSFNEFGEVDVNLVIPHIDRAWLLWFNAEFVIPGTEEFDAGKGIKLVSGGDLDIETPRMADSD